MFLKREKLRNSTFLLPLYLLLFVSITYFSKDNYKWQFLNPIYIWHSPKTSRYSCFMSKIAILSAYDPKIRNATCYKQP